MLIACSGRCSTLYKQIDYAYSLLPLGRKTLYLYDWRILSVPYKGGTPKANFPNSNFPTYNSPYTLC